MAKCLSDDSTHHTDDDGQRTAANPLKCTISLVLVGITLETAMQGGEQRVDQNAIPQSQGLAGRKVLALHYQVAATEEEKPDRHRSPLAGAIDGDEHTREHH